ncbi:MAG: hypothetical protein ACT4QG_14300 [Sporichthyaceae bacterium]
MIPVQWFVFPVAGGFELVVDSTDELVLEAAMADIAATYPDYLIAKEWVLDTGDVVALVPAAAVPPQRSPRSVAEEKSRAAHPAGKGRKK